MLALAISAIAAPVIRKSDKERADRLVSQMTIDEKLNFISGKIDAFHTYAVERLGIPSITMADGPQGVRNVNGKTIRSTFFPCGVSAAASWNRAAVREMGAGIGCAAKAHGVQIMLGPGVNIYRSALCGRNFEYYGEDPYLASETASSYIQGMQDEGVISTIKHFALNQQEYDRHGTSSNADERTINEIYFPTFRKAVEVAKVGAVMTSYNPINGTHAAENPWLVKDNLRKWGFRGIVMTDWTSTYNSIDFIKGGVDLEMPSAYVTNPEKLKELLENGVISEADIDEKCRHILQTFSAYGFLDGKLDPDPAAEDPALSQKRAYEIALEGPVLLKNEGDILPLKPGKKNLIAVIGPNANAITCGGGSGWVNPEDGKGVTMYEGLKALGKNYTVELLSGPNPEILKKASVVILGLGFDRLTEAEGKDRSYDLDRFQRDLIETVAGYNENLVVVANSGGEFNLDPWADKVKAIILDWYPGQEGGNAIAAILSGKVSPSGRLPFTFWGSLKANPAQKWYGKVPRHPRSGRHQYDFTEYGEGIFLGYRGADHFGVKPLYAFGYGLTYSEFKYSDIAVAASGDGFEVSFTLTNVGKKEASEVAQVYVSPVNPSVPRPLRELKGYEKVKLAPGKSASVKIFLDRASFAHYDVDIHDWKVDAGSYKIQVAASAEDVKLEQEVQL